MSGSENRLRLITLSILFFALLLVSKLYFLQIIKGEDFEIRAEHQYVAGVNHFDRGGIFFSTKDGTLVPAAGVKLGHILHVNPPMIIEYGDIEGVYEKLNSIIPIDRASYDMKIAKID